MPVTSACYRFLKHPPAATRQPPAAIKGRIHSFETFGAADGPGVRFIVFLSGCPLRCAYCHNPDTWASPPAFEQEPREVLDRALRYRAYWGEDGGITVSGGEPLLQPEFVSELFELAGAEGISAALDTSGYVEGAADDVSIFSNPLRPYAKLLSLADVVILDIKAFDADLHRRVTGRSGEPMLAFARHCAGMGKRMWIRRVLVPGLTDGEADLRATGEFVRSLGSCVERVEVLPYHDFAIPKYERLGIPYPLRGAVPPTPGQVAAARSLLGAG